MFNFLNNLVRGLRTTKTARPTRRAPRRASLQVESLEDRLLMTSAIVNAIPGGAHTQPIVQLGHTTASTGNQAPSSLQISEIEPGIRIYSDGAGQTDVQNLFGGPVFHFTTSSINSLTIFDGNANGDGQTNVVQIDDSKGMPFAPGTTISLSGPGSATLELQGSQTINGGETYVAGGATSTPGEVLLGNVTFKFDSSVGGVFDSIPITGTLDVQTSGTGVLLNSLPNYGSGEQQLFGMGAAGGFLEFSNKPMITLEEYAPNATIFLDTTTAASGEKLFEVNMHGAGDTTTVDMTPSGVRTDVVSYIAPVANNASVAVWGNRGPVDIGGNSSTQVSIGYPLGNGLYVTRGILADVTVAGAAALAMQDSGNVSTPENVKVTESTITGNGLFGSNGVTLFYSSVAELSLVTGQRADTYTVAPSVPGAAFTSRIDIADISSDRFIVGVFVDSGSNLNLHLYSDSTQTDSELTIHPGGGTVTRPGRIPLKPQTGTADVLFAGVIGSQVSYQDFDGVGVQN
jgi:hypothetical protein